MGFLLRFSSFLVLVMAIFAGTIDAIRSISESAPILTPLGSTVAAFSASGTALVESLERQDGAMPMLEPLIRWCLQQPAVVVCLAIALVLWMAGYRRPVRRGRVAA